MSLGLLVTVKEAAKLSASSSSPGLAEGGGLPTMELPGEWPDRPGGDLRTEQLEQTERRSWCTNICTYIGSTGYPKYEDLCSGHILRGLHSLL